MLCCVHAVAHSNAPKQVVYTPWWPPGTEKSAESVGIFLPRVQTLYMTGMMEVNDTLGLEVGMELDDARDIAANVSFTPLTDSLVDCIVNVPPAAAAAGTAARAVRAAFEEKLGSADAVPALTVVGAAGEYTWANSSISCIARRGLSAKRVRRVPLGAGVDDAVAVGEATAVAVDADVWVAATVPIAGSIAQASNTSNTSSSSSSASASPATTLAADLSWLSELLGAAGAAPADLIDCTVFVGADAAGDQVAKAAVRELRRMSASDGVVAREHSTTAAAAVSAVRVRSLASLQPQGGASYALRCFASAGAAASKRSVRSAGNTASTGEATPYAVSARGQVFVEATPARLRNATDAFAGIERALKGAGSSMKLAANCVFWVRQLSRMGDLFEGFYQTFNVDAYPPPSRTEFVGTPFSCESCAVLAKCVGAMP